MQAFCRISSQFCKFSCHFYKFSQGQLVNGTFLPHGKCAHHFVRHIGFLEIGDVLGCESEGEGFRRVVEVFFLGGADNGSKHAAGKMPRESDVRHGDAVTFGRFCDAGNNGLVLFFRFV